jgi:PKD repeat protein
LTRIENKWLAPKPAFRAYPKNGTAPLTVKFQNFSTGKATRFLWDFGDGATSTEKNPVHIYHQDGVYTIKLNIVSATGPQAVAEKPNYITVNENQQTPIFYISPMTGYSIETDSINPTEFELIDQSDGDITERHWFFGDGQEITISNPNIHSITHKYNKPGDYAPSLILKLADQRIRRIPANYTITVI